MKRIVVLLALVVFAAGLVVFSNDMAFSAWGKDKAIAKEEENTPTAEEAKLIYTFKSDEELAEFEQLYIAKQATFGRMGVLQAYFSLEQNNLTEIDKQMNEKFRFTMDPSKMYDLNREIKEIKEVGLVPTAMPVE
ncbi:hypothetical protein KKE87_04145 [Patescibacteria group bacterium]|nr:hypothetical protein [Patescibacteria group bacterium]